MAVVSTFYNCTYQVPHEKKKSKMARVKKLKFLNDPMPQKEKQNDLQSSEEVMESLVTYRPRPDTGTKGAHS